MHEQKRADALLGCNSAARQNTETGYHRESSDGNQADVGIARCKLIGALRRKHPAEFVTLRQFWRDGRMLEVPHKRCGIKEADGGDAKLAVRN